MGGGIAAVGDTLEAQLHRTQTLGSHLLDSTLHHLLAART
jgi:hypothetical protein